MGSSMETDTEKAYDAFMGKVKRTVYLDNLSPQVTEPVIKTAFEQYGNVTNIRFIPSYMDPYYNSRCALVELETAKQASNIIDMVSTYPFMMAAMPRPVRARPAEPEMFDERPIKPGRKIQFYWLKPSDPDFEVAKRIKYLVKKHSQERSFLLKKQQEEEEKLSRQQYETLKGHYHKFESLESVQPDSKHLAKCYNMKLADENGY